MEATHQLLSRAKKLPLPAALYFRVSIRVARFSLTGRHEPNAICRSRTCCSCNVLLQHFGFGRRDIQYLVEAARESRRGFRDRGERDRATVRSISSGARAGENTALVREFAFEKLLHQKFLNCATGRTSAMVKGFGGRSRRGNEACDFYPLERAIRAGPRAAKPRNPCALPGASKSLCGRLRTQFGDPLGANHQKCSRPISDRSPTALDLGPIRADVALIGDAIETGYRTVVEFQKLDG